MKEKQKWILPVVIFLVVLAGAALLYRSLSARYLAQGVPAPSPSASVPAPSESAETEAVQAPDFTVLDAQGDEVALSDFFRKPIVLNFWATWCGPCKSELPTFDALYTEYGDRVHFLLVNLTDGKRDTVEGVQAFLEDNSYTFPTYFDTLYSGATAYGIYGIPVTYFIDSAGLAVAGHSGAITEALLRSQIEGLLE